MALLHVMQFYAGTISSTTATNLYTVPAGDRIVLRTVSVQNQSSSAVVFTLALSGGPTIVLISTNPEGTSGDNFQWRPWIVLPAGAVLQGKVLTAHAVGVILSGSIYTI